jgi:hypothetical protein
MGKQDKREERIRANTRNVSIEEFEALIKRYGEIIEGHSHPKAHINNHFYPYKRQNPVSAHYVEDILRFIDEMKGE